MVRSVGSILNSNGEPFKEVKFQSAMTTFAYQQIFSGCPVENELRKNKTGGSEPIMELINESRWEITIWSRGHSEDEEK